MSRTKFVASYGPLIAPVERKGKRSGAARWLSALALLLLAMAVAPSAALAASEPTSGYKQEPTSGYKQEPKKTTTTKTTSGVSPAKEEAKVATSPSSSVSSSTTEAKASTLPFTGFDLRWEIGIGALLILGGAATVTLQRRQRRIGSH